MFLLCCLYLFLSFTEDQRTTKLWTCPYGAVLFAVCLQLGPVRNTDCLCHISMTNTDEVLAVVVGEEGGGQKKEREMDEQRDNDGEVEYEPSALRDVLNANCLTWLCARGLFRTKDSSLVSEPTHWGETHLDKVSHPPPLSLAIRRSHFLFSKARSVSSGSPHLATLSFFVSLSIQIL